MKVIVASSERFAGCMIHALIRAGHEVIAVLSPFQGIYDRQFEGMRFVFYDWLGWDIRKACKRYKVPLRVSRQLSDGSVLTFLKQATPDLLVVFGWPKLISQTVLGHFRLGGINVHPSLLPKLRGADPIFDLVDKYKLHFGISFHRLAPTLDTGVLFYQEPLDFSPHHTYDDLYLKTIRAIHRHLPDALDKMLLKPEGSAQVGTATYTAKFLKSSRFLDPQNTRAFVTRRALACYSHHPMLATLGPAIFSFRRCRKLKLSHSHLVPPGTLLAMGPFSLKVKLGDYHASLEGIRFLGSPWWQTPFKLARLCRLGDRLGSPKQTRLAWRQWCRSINETKA